MSYNPQIANQVSNLKDPKESSNWSLVDRKQYTSTNPSGVSFNVSRYDKFKIVIRSNFAHSSGQMYARFNNDSTTANYSYQRLKSIGSSIIGSYINSDSGMIIADYGWSAIYSDLEFIPSSRHGIRRISVGGQSGNQFIQVDGVRYLTDVTINTINIYSTMVFTGIIEVYGWNDIKTVDMVSYELVKEYNLNNQYLNTSIPWNGDIDNECIIESMITTNNTDSAMYARLNGDSSSINYSRGTVLQDGSVVNGSFSNSSGIVINGSATNGLTRLSRTVLNLKSGSYRLGNTIATNYSSGDVDSTVYIQGVHWKNSVDKVSSIVIALENEASRVTGSVKVFRPARSHVLCQFPNLLTGLWQKRIDNNTIEISPGEIEINGILHNNYSSINITLSGSLRTGESESSNTTYYLYAIAGSNRSLTYKFSTVAPLLDRYSNTYSDIYSVDTKQALHHPNEGCTWRYIGQVRNDASSNIIGFNKTGIDYFESDWRPIPGTGQVYISHGLGKAPRGNTVQYQFKLDLANNPVEQIHAYMYNSNYYGTYSNFAEPHTDNLLNSYFGPGGVYHNGQWRTTGYYKVIIK